MLLLQLATCSYNRWVMTADDIVQVLMIRRKAEQGGWLNSFLSLISTDFFQLHSFNIIDQLHNFPREPKVLVIHGERDQAIPMKFAQVREDFDGYQRLRHPQDMMDRIPTAKFIQTGDRPGQVPNLAFGHTCWVYFDLDVWANVVNEFIRQ